MRIRPLPHTFTPVNGPKYLQVEGMGIYMDPEPSPVCIPFLKPTGIPPRSIHCSQNFHHLLDQHIYHLESYILHSLPLRIMYPAGPSGLALLHFACPCTQLNSFHMKVYDAWMCNNVQQHITYNHIQSIRRLSRNIWHRLAYRFPPRLDQYVITVSL